jgi:hypothetical protein
LDGATRKAFPNIHHVLGKAGQAIAPVNSCTRTGKSDHSNEHRLEAMAAWKKGKRTTIDADLDDITSAMSKAAPCKDI